MNHAGTGILINRTIGKCNRQHGSLSFTTPQIDAGVLHRDFGTQITVNPFHRSPGLGFSTLGFQAVDVAGPILNRRIAAKGIGMHKHLNHGRMQTVFRIDWCRAAFDIVNARAILNHDQRPLKLPRIFGIDSKKALQRRVSMHALWYIDKRAARPDRRIQCRKNIVIGMNQRRKILFDDFGMFLNRRIRIHENDSLA